MRKVDTNLYPVIEGANPMKHLTLSLAVVLIVAMFVVSTATPGELNPTTKTFTEWGTSWDATRTKALQAAENYYNGIPYKVMDETKEWDPNFHPANEQFKITIWTMPCF